MPDEQKGLPGRRVLCHRLRNCHPERRSWPRRTSATGRQRTVPSLRSGWRYL